MTTPGPPDITGLLTSWRDGDRQALDRLMPIVYDELRRLAHRRMQGERPGHPLQTTALVNEAYLRLVDVTRVQWQNREHFFAMAAQMMRRVLVDAARERRAQKRGGDLQFVPLDQADAAGPVIPLDLVALDDALEALATFDARKARVIELRYFGGLGVEDTAAVLGVSSDTVLREWRVARLWLSRELHRSRCAHGRRGP